MVTIINTITPNYCLSFSLLYYVFFSKVSTVKLISINKNIYLLYTSLKNKEETTENNKKDIIDKTIDYGSIKDQQTKKQLLLQ